ncbi:MAG TPA: hypothetical protein VLC50_07050 [Actinomycetes bacterium]|nr:hypothetical protein [Actinomycetes bacterium]
MVVTVALVGVLLAGAYLWGARHPQVSVHEGMALSMEAGISVEADGRLYAIPVDVRWQDERGLWHDHGRPECLPPVGIGELGPVRFGTVTVATEPGRWTQTVWVSCGG